MKPYNKSLNHKPPKSKSAFISSSHFSYSSVDPTIHPSSNSLFITTTVHPGGSKVRIWCVHRSTSNHGSTQGFYWCRLHVFPHISLGGMIGCLDAWMGWMGWIWDGFSQRLRVISWVDVTIPYPLHLLISRNPKSSHPSKGSSLGTTGRTDSKDLCACIPAKNKIWSYPGSLRLA